MPFSPYLTTLLLDSPHDEIVVAEEDSFEDSDHRDTDHRIEATLRFSDGHHETVQLGKDVGLPERRQRFVRLAHNLLVTQNDQNRNKDVMPTIICKGLLDSTGAQKLDFRCRRYRTQTLADAKSSDPRFRDPTDEHFLKTSYSADAEIDSDGAFNINRHEESKSDVAPVKGANTALPPSVPPVTLPPRRP